MKEFFEEFIKSYDMHNPRINYKYYHSYRVMDLMHLLAKDKKLSPDDTKIAECIGLFHDIGRFIQEEQIGCFNDLILDHGDIGSSYIKKENVLSKCHLAKKDYPIVYKAIKNHNKFHIENSLNEREMLFSKLIRDADKLDILYALGNSQIKDKISEDNSQISKEVKDAFFKGISVTKSIAKNKNDKLIIVFSFIFDIYMDTTMNIIKNNDYYNKIYERLENKEIFAPYIKYINEYINERTDNNVRKKI